MKERLIYEAPLIEVLEVACEDGFAASSPTPATPIDEWIPKEF